MLTRAGSLRGVRGNLIEADDNPHSELYTRKRTTRRLSRHRKPVGGAKACGSPVWFARRSDARFCSHALPPKPPSANVRVPNCRMNEDPGKVITRLRTAALPRLADVMTVCDELESRLSTVGLQSPPLFSTKAVVSTECPVCAGRREAKRRAMANGANRDLHHHRRAKHTPRQGGRPLLRRPRPHNLHATPRRRSLLAGTRRTINRRHRHHLVLRPRSLGTALHYPLRRQPHRHGRSLQKGRMKADASPAHALAQHSRCQIAPC